MDNSGSCKWPKTSVDGDQGMLAVDQVVQTFCFFDANHVLKMSSDYASHNTTQHNTAQHNTTQHNTTQHTTTQHTTTQHNTTHHNTTQHNTTHHNTAQHKIKIGRIERDLPLPMRQPRR
jgi:hypothetical protein